MTSSHAPKAKTWWTSLLIKQRERAACPQLRCVPPDLRVDGARHASRESLPPSKPCRPQGARSHSHCTTSFKSLYQLGLRRYNRWCPQATGPHAGPTTSMTPGAFDDELSRAFHSL